MLVAVALAWSQGLQAATVPKPGDDFFAFANADWLAATSIPPGKKRWAARDDISAVTRRQVADVVMAAVAKRTPSNAKVADFYSAWLDERNIEGRGLAPLARQLDSIAALHDKTALARWLGAHAESDADPLDVGTYDSSQLFGVSVGHGIRGETATFVYLVQGGLVLDSRDDYLNETVPARERREHYRDYIARQLELAGFDRTKERAAAVLALETAIARAHASNEESTPDANADHHWPRAEFPKRAPGFDWTAFFTAASLAQRSDVVVWQPAAASGEAALVASTPIAVWQDYLRFHLVDRHADVLPRAFAQAAADFRGSAQHSRAEGALEATNRALPMQVGKLYVEKYFPREYRERVETIRSNVLAAFRLHVAAAAWMSPASRQMALAKLDTLYFDVGYPESWPDDAGLVIDAHDAFGNQDRLARWNYRRTIAKLGRPVDRHEWKLAPQSAAGLLNFGMNSYNFSAALLQPPKFDANAPEAANYGAIGAIMGHEISHFVDTLGAEYDARGADVHWWTDADSTQYEAASRALVEQFGGYEPFDGVRIDGKAVLVENVADLGGLAAALDACRRALGAGHDREFFLGFARAWRAKLTDEALRAQSSSGDHAPETFRVSTVRNFDAWYEAFDVKPGERLYLEPGARGHIW
jgi:putative endopeptidase